MLAYFLNILPSSITADQQYLHGGRLEVGWTASIVTKEAPSCKPHRTMARLEKQYVTKIYVNNVYIFQKARQLISANRVAL